ncbi:HTH_38 domain-containing protein [Trichonephila clavipes]|nr:HTH_38 domain-containing protein [Trichonephila clavipes]
MSRRKQRSALDQSSEFDRVRVVAYRDCGLSFLEFGSRVGRNQTTVMRICDRWMQEGTANRRGRSHPPQCTISREDRTTDISAGNGAMKEGYDRQNGMKLSLLTSNASVCNTTIVGFESGDTAERGCLTAALCTTTLVLHRVLWVYYWLQCIKLPCRKSNLGNYTAQEKAVLVVITYQTGIGIKE